MNCRGPSSHSMQPRNPNGKLQTYGATMPSAADSDYNALVNEDEKGRVITVAPMANMKKGKRNHHGDLVESQLPMELKQYLVYPDQKAELRISMKPSCLDRIMCCVCLPYAICCKMVLIKQGQIGLTWHGDEPSVIGPGRHYLVSLTHRLFAIRNIDEPVIIHGPLKIIRVRLGELGFGIDTETGEPMLLTAGKHVINSPTFKFERMLDLTLRTNQLGVMKLIRVETGCVGYAYKSGKLVILQPGLHVVVPPDRFGNILSTQQQTITLPEGVHESADYVSLKIRADVFYRIVNPKLALTNIKDVELQIKETAVSTLAGIIRSSTLNEIANSSKVSYSKTTSADGKEVVTQQPSAPPFFKHVHDQFMENLHDHMLEDWGIELHNIRIESLKINDPRLASDISKQAVAVSQQEAKYRMLQKQAEVIQVEADNKKTQRLKQMEADNMITQTKAQASANARLKETEATNQIIQSKAAAEGAALLRMAEAEAKATLLRAKAAKEAKELQGQGDAGHAALLESSALGGELAKLRVQANMMSGLQQVAYVPHLPEILQKTQFTTPLKKPFDK